MRTSVFAGQLIVLLLLFPLAGKGQSLEDKWIDAQFKQSLMRHKELVSLPNLPQNRALMEKNLHWLTKEFNQLNFRTSLLPSSTLPLLLAEKIVDPNLKTVLFYFHIDGQPVDPAAWDQENPFVPVLKERDEQGQWTPLNWEKLEGEIDDEWRIFARAAADDKAPIIMLLEALRILEDKKKQAPTFNLKIIFDPEEEYASKALLSTLERYKKRYAADYFIVMDGPMHNSNQPTLTFGCRGIATCSITTYGATLPQHSGHYGNYSPNPAFELSRILASMKDTQGRVLVKDFYKGIQIDGASQKLLRTVPYDSLALNKALGIYSPEKVGKNYQESLQYPSLNVRQMGTSWKGEGLKTVIPAYAVAHIDVRLVPETEGTAQLQKIKRHLEQEGYHVLDCAPTDQERQEFPKIVKFNASSRVVNSFRTNPNDAFGRKIRTQLEQRFGTSPINIRLMGGTVPIVPLINKLDLPTLIVPMVNMDNNQHSPNENIRIGNIRQGIKICLAILTTEL